MSFLLDVIVIAIIAVTVYFAARNGFVKTAVSAVSFLIAVAVTAMFASPLADVLKNTSIADTVETSVADTVESILQENSGLDSLLNGESDEFNALLEVAGIEADELKAQIASEGDEAVAAVAKHIAEPITDLIALLVAIVVLYIGTQVLLSIAAYFLNKLANLPVLRTANKGLGIVLGAVLALFRVCLFCFAMNVLIEHSEFLNSDLLNGLNPDSTFLFNMFSNIDIFSFFI